MRIVLLALLAAPVAVPSPAIAQAAFSESYTFLKAVREADATAVTEMLNRPGQTFINIRDRTTGQAALHIVTERSDATYLRFLLQKGANPNIQDERGTTAALIAVEKRFTAGISMLRQYRADFNVANASGETPLIRAVQLRDANMVRALLEAGANPDQADVIAGMSARDYARRDSRSPQLLAIIETADKTPRAPAASGPRL